MDTKYECPVCGSAEFYIEKISGHFDVFCRNCGGWQGRLDQNLMIRLGDKHDSMP